MFQHYKQHVMLSLTITLIISTCQSQAALIDFENQTPGELLPFNIDDIQFTTAGEQSTPVPEPAHMLYHDLLKNCRAWL